MNPFEYNNGEGIVPKDAFRISPSQLSRFFDQTSQWYREFLLEETPQFIGNTATELGTCVHAAAEMFTNLGIVNHKSITDYIASINNPDVDKSTILEQYPIMVETLINNYLIPNSQYSTETEKFVWQPILPNIGVGGSIDRLDLTRNRIVDYKTMGSLDKARLPKSFPRTYYFQQLSYAWALKQQSIHIDYIDLVYITRNNTGRYNDKGKPLKDYPSQTHILTMQVTKDDLDFIESVLKLVAHSVKLWKENPGIRFALAQDFRLYKPPKILFK